MNKALLIVEAPEACNKCEFYQLACVFDGKLHGTCARIGEYINPEEVTIKKSNKCPLISVDDFVNLTFPKVYERLVNEILEGEDV